jgi:NAD(P)-dependent dehydrogenase (short-subunit alcohol dehydrogenase family)
VVDDMLKRASGRIINISSTAGLSGYPYVSHYCAAKHGVVGFTKALALELAEHGITVNAVCPGMTDTDLLTDSIKRVSQKTGLNEADVRKQFISSNLIGRLIEPSEVASAVLWLCHPDQASVTGQTVVVDGEAPKLD